MLKEMFPESELLSQKRPPTVSKEHEYSFYPKYDKYSRFSVMNIRHFLNDAVAYKYSCIPVVSMQLMSVECFFFLTMNSGWCSVQDEFE